MTLSSLCQRACLVEYDSAAVHQSFQAVVTFDECPPAGGLADTRTDRSPERKSNRTWAGDQQHRQRSHRITRQQEGRPRQQER